MLWSRQRVITLIIGVCIPGRIAQCITQGEYRIFVYFISVNLFYSYSYSLMYARYTALKQQYISYTNTNFPVMISTSSKVLSAIKKALQNLVEEY